MKNLKIIDFLQDRFSYGVAYLISNSLIILVMSLTLLTNKKQIPLENILYALLISLVVFIVFLIYEYNKISPFSGQLKSMLSSDNILESILNIKHIKNKEQELVKNVFLNIYKFYINKVDKYEESHNQYTIFVNQWVHQMKTPVSVINLILQDQFEEEYKHIFSSIEEENEKLSQGLDMMLYNARLNEFNHDFNVETVDILALTQKVINHNKKSFIGCNIYPKVSGSQIKIHSDKKWLYFVINQIVINAIKYTKIAHREKRIINLTISDDTSNIILSIEDNGIGIPKEDLGRIFNAFFTGKNGRKTSESTGMGLYLSKRICEELGHKLTVESEEGVGTKFNIIFHKEKNIFTL